MSKDLSDKYYQNKKETLQKSLVRNIKVFGRRKRIKVTIWAQTI